MQKKEELFNIEQACLQLQINDRNLRVALIKFPNQQFSLKTWETKLRDDKLLK